MLDQVFAKIAPAKVLADIDDIDGELALLDQEREEHRLSAGRLVQAEAHGFDSGREGEIRKHHVRIAEIDASRGDLRARRRYLLDTLKPEPEAKKALVQVAMPRELVAAMDALEEARAARRKLIEERHTDTSEASEKKRAGRLADIEEEIRDLRIRRAELLVPYNAELTAALAPYLRASVEKLDKASEAFLEALQEIAEINPILPPAAPGYGNGLAPLLCLNRRGALDARAWCAVHLQRNPPEGAAS